MSKNRSAVSVAYPRRRTLLKAGALGAAASALGVPLVAGAASGTVVVRSLGGSYEDALVQAIHKPFTQATGIEVVLQAATAGQVRAMILSGHASVDVIDIGLITQLAFDREKLLAPLDYDAMKYTNPGDLFDSVRKPNYVGSLYFASVMAYNTQAFTAENHPKTWAEFWDTKKFPGARTYPSQTAGSVPLEFAMMAAGKPMAQIYPIDLDQAFASLGRLKPAVVKWWDTGAISAQLLDQKEAVLGVLWNGRVQDLIDKGAPLAIEWNQARREIQGLSIVKNAQNMANAQKFVDFSLQPKVQAEVSRLIAYGPTNRQAIQYIDEKNRVKLPSEPAHFKNSFDMNYEWWSDNLTAVGNRWQSWVLS